MGVNERVKIWSQGITYPATVLAGYIVTSALGQFFLFDFASQTNNIVAGVALLLSYSGIILGPASLAYYRKSNGLMESYEGWFALLSPVFAAFIFPISVVAVLFFYTLDSLSPDS